MPSTNPDSTPTPKPKAKAKAKVEAPVLSITELEAKLQELKSQASAAKAAVDAAKPAAPAESTPLTEKEFASQAVGDEVARAEILRDPYDSKNALKILTDPPGKKLRWMSIQYRETRGMKGWTAVRYDDPIGREIHRYVGEPPSRMLGTAEADMIVRRGDVFLAWIDYGIWAARQVARVRDATRRVSKHTTKSQNAIGEHAATTGDGLTADVNPYQVIRKAPGFVDPNEQAYRDKARGTPADVSQRVAGRNLFEEASDEE